MHPLDNVIWEALTTRQSQFAETKDTARKFIREVSPLAGVQAADENGYTSLAALVGARASAGICRGHRGGRDTPSEGDDPASPWRIPRRRSQARNTSDRLDSKSRTRPWL